MCKFKIQLKSAGRYGLLFQNSYWNRKEKQEEIQQENMGIETWLTWSRETLEKNIQVNLLINIVKTLLEEKNKNKM